jgi:hypothetical protein
LIKKPVFLPVKLKTQKHPIDKMSLSSNHYYNVSTMMNSPPLSDRGSDRIDRRMIARSAADARIEGISMPFETTSGPAKEYIMNPIQAFIMKKPTLEDVGEDFDIPQRFTKSGRKKAVPFPLKVRIRLSLSFHSTLVVHFFRSSLFGFAVIVQI